MTRQRLVELLALWMIGDGVATALEPERHLRLWRGGPHFYRALTDVFLERPELTRVLGIAEAGLGIWLASRQRRDPSWREMLRRARERVPGM